MPPIDSKDWTGPPEDRSRRWSVFTGRSGDPHFSSDYARLAAAQHAALAVPPEVRAVKSAAAVLLFSPLMLWLAWVVARAAIGDQAVQDNGGLVIAWGTVTILIAGSQLGSGSARFAGARRFLLWLLVAATGLASIGYGYAMLSSHAAAKASTPERLFELAERKRGRRTVIAFYQRADGTRLGGGATRIPATEGRTCVLGQRLDGEYGFSWIRVLDRSRAPGRGQLAWPISRDECFSATPLATLPR